MRKQFYLPRNLMVESTKALKDLFDMRKWLKYMLDLLHVPYYDTCCDESKTDMPVHYDMNDDTAEYYNGEEWVPFGSGAGGALDPGEATTPNGTTLDWGGTITHDVNVDSDGVVPLPSIYWGETNPMLHIAMTSTRDITFNSNDVFIEAADSFDVDSTNIGFTQADQFNLDADKVSIRSASKAFVGSSGGTMGFWHFTTHNDKTDTEEGFQVDQINRKYQVGDFNSTSNDTTITVDDSNAVQKITLNANNGIVIGTVQAFADNAAAITGGLTVGTIYRNGDVLQIVH